MHIIFALILILPNYREAAAVRVGVYEKLSQCQQQGKRLAENANAITLKAYGPVEFQCVPVNG